MLRWGWRRRASTFLASGTTRCAAPGNSLLSAWCSVLPAPVQARTLGMCICYTCKLLRIKPFRAPRTACVQPCSMYGVYVCLRARLCTRLNGGRSAAFNFRLKSGKVAGPQDLVDIDAVTTNDVGAVGRSLGVEAARAALLAEVTRVFGVYGIAVDKRHLSLLADFMTHQATLPLLPARVLRCVRPCNRTLPRMCRALG